LSGRVDQVLDPKPGASGIALDLVFGVLLGRQDTGTERRCHFVVHLGNEVQRALVARRNQRVELVRELGRHGLLEKLRRQPGVRRAQLLVQSHRS
jgi:hypothetical protein